MAVEGCHISIEAKWTDDKNLQCMSVHNYQNRNELFGLNIFDFTHTIIFKMHTYPIIPRLNDDDKLPQGVMRLFQPVLNIKNSD